MDTIEQAGPSIWMDAEAEGLLGNEERARLDAYLATADPKEVAGEREIWNQLHTVLREDCTAVRPSFQSDVMEAIDPTLWEKTPAGAWKLPLAMMLSLALGAAWMLGGVATDHPVMGTGSVMADFVQSTFLAGAGVTVAMWRGVGMGLEEMLAGSSFSWAAMLLLVVSINLLFVSLLRRRSSPAQARASLSRASSTLSPDDVASNDASKLDD